MPNDKYTVGGFVPFSCFLSRTLQFFSASGALFRSTTFTSKIFFNSSKTFHPVSNICYYRESVPSGMFRENKMLMKEKLKNEVKDSEKCFSSTGIPCELKWLCRAPSVYNTFSFGIHNLLNFI